MADSVNVYDIGDEVVVMADFADRNGNPQNPTTVSIVLEDPTGARHTLTATAPSPTGHFEATYVVDMPGDWYYRWAGTAGLRAAGEKMFRVRGSRFN